MLPGQLLALEKAKDDPQSKSREVRLGLVLYGGVSLAIYITGVCREFFRAVHGRGVYRLIKALTDSDVVVDIVSGTSAGGINGIALSFALCNNKNFADVANLWRRHGDIGQLLRPPFRDTPPPSSLLDSENYYLPQLTEAFARMSDYTPEEFEDPSPFSELDLFVTGTDVEGTVTTQFDAAGHPIMVKDHRSVFLLKHRAGRKEPFNPRFPNGSSNPDPAITYAALGKLAAITSCFPGAFAPVHVARAQGGDDSVDAKLQMWGKLGKEAYLVDGGVLDNHPFSHTIRAIFSRSADREVERKLFYVEPDPAEVKKAEEPRQPNFLQVIVGANTDIPSYQSISDDLKLLAERNSKLQQYDRLVANLQMGALLTVEPTPLYTRSRLVFLSDRVVQAICRPDGRNDLLSPELHQKATELIQLFDRFFTDAPAKEISLFFDDFDVYFRLRRAYRIIYLIYDVLYKQKMVSLNVDGLAEPVKALRDLLNAMNRQVELYEVLRSAMEALVDDASATLQDQPAQQIWASVQQALYCLLADDTGLAQRIQDQDLAELEATKQWLSDDKLAALGAELRDRRDGIVGDIRTKRFSAANNPPTATLFKRLDGYERLILEHFVPDPGDLIRQVYGRFEALDAQLFPLEQMGDLYEKDIIATSRISARDAQRGFSNNSFSDKVSGDTVHHFGGFFKRSWRSNDILWGRLDGLCQLTESLLSYERVKQIAGSDEWRRTVRGRFFAEDGQTGWKRALDPAVLFSHAGERTQSECRKWLAQLLSDDPAARDAALDPKEYDRMVTLLIEAAQLEVIYEELPTVITDAIEEQAAWNRFQQQNEPQPARGRSWGKRSPTPRQPQHTAMQNIAMSPGDERLPWVFQASGRRLDPFVAIVAAAETMRATMEQFSVAGNAPRPGDTRLGQFFRQSYRVGSEKLTRDIPTLVLLEILMHTLLVLRNVILGLFGESAGRIRRHPLYRFGLDYPLRAIYSLIILSRRAPRLGLTVFFGLAVLSILALVVGAIWWNQIIWSQGQFYRLPFFVFIVIPIVILLLELLYLLTTRELRGLKRTREPR